MFPVLTSFFRSLATPPRPLGRPLPAHARRWAVVVLLSLAAAACGAPDTDAPASDASETVAFTGATLWDGSGAAPVRDATLVVRDGRVVSVTGGGSVPDGAREVDLGGNWIVPGLIDAHAHVTGRWASADTTDEAARVRGDLRLYARYGVTSVNSLGGDPEAAFAVRDATGASPSHARVTLAGTVVAETDPAAARAVVAEQADRDVDWIKIRVDDNLGSSTRMSDEVIEAVADEAHGSGLRLATHLFYLDDAKHLLRTGATDLVAHSVRDQAVDDELIGLLRERRVCYVPTLVREVTAFVYRERPDFFDDPFFTRWADSAEVARVSDPAYQATVQDSRSARLYEQALDQATRNLTAVHAAGLPVAMGTDSGPAGRFPGWYDHEELARMVGAGLSPAEALFTATGGAAACLGRDDVGILEPGRYADFLVLSADPLADIQATRALEGVYLGGRELR